jgi:hypothetical protein
VAEESSQNDKPPEQPARKKTKVPQEIREQTLAPKPSFWPIALALTLVTTAIGVIVVNTTPIILVGGIVLTILVIIAWILEKP